MVGWNAEIWQMVTFPSRGLWIGLLVLFAIDGIWLATSDFQVLLPTWPLAAGVCCTLLAAAWFYTAVRPSAEIAHMCLATLYLILLTGAIAMFSYLLTSLGHPLLDQAYVDIDRFLGFDWLAFLEWTNDRPLLDLMLTLSYHSSMPQIAGLIVLLAMTGRLERINEFLGLFLVTSTTVVVIAGFFPAVGAYVYYIPAPELVANPNSPAGLWHLEQFNGLRDGSLRQIDLSAAEGLVTFPSFHTCLAIIVTWATRDFRAVFCAAAVLNGAVIVSTLPEGGHHLIDVIAGTFITVVAIVVRSKARISTRTPDTERPVASSV